MALLDMRQLKLRPRQIDFICWKPENRAGLAGLAPGWHPYRPYTRQISRVEGSCECTAYNI